MKMQKWEGKVAVVTGANGGIGAGICKELVRKGMIVCGLSKRVDKVEILRSELGPASEQLNAVECDVRDENSISAALTWIINTFGSIDLLINNAGVMVSRLILDANNSKEIHKLIETSLLGTVFMTRKVIAIMEELNINGEIIIVNSVLGHKTNIVVPGIKPINCSYPVAKYGVTCLSEYLNQEIRYLGKNIRISTISPGLTEQDILTQPYQHHLVKYMPKLKMKDVTDAVEYLMNVPSHIHVSEVKINPVGEFL